jgi:hypothetical protein
LENAQLIRCSENSGLEDGGMCCSWQKYVLCVTLDNALLHAFISFYTYILSLLKTYLNNWVFFIGFASFSLDFQGIWLDGTSDIPYITGVAN